MFYKPKFCCNCGEKIERADWGLFASRRFCEFCETEQKHHDYLIRAVAGASLFFGVLGLTGFFSAGGRGAAHAGDPVQISSKPSQINLKKAAGSTAATVPSAVERIDTGSVTAAPGHLSKQLTSQAKPSTEPTYYCGALTKKGTPCSRRVKVKGHCWQHAGRPPEPENDDKNGD